MKIICIGRNYANHAKELKNSLPEEPVIFLKPKTALLPKGKDFYYPEFTRDLHHEAELVVKISKTGKHIQEKFAHKYYEEITVGIDFTARDIQQKQKEKGLPWEIAKAFDHAAVTGDFISLSALPPIQQIHFSLQKNKQEVQTGFSGDMLFPVNRMIAYISQFFTLQTGDLIFTGTPEGVGPVKIGDSLEGYIGNKQVFHLAIK